MPITNVDAFLRSFFSGALTSAATTTSALPNGIRFSEGVGIKLDAVPRGGWSASTDSREPDIERSEDERDQSCECEATIRVRCAVTSGTVYDMGSNLYDAVDRALRSYVPEADTWSHPVTGETIEIIGPPVFSVGLKLNSHNPDSTPPESCIVIYATLRYRRIWP